MLSIGMALLMIQHNQFLSVPFAMQQKAKRPIEKILINAVGFGGNAVSIVLRKA